MLQNKLRELMLDPKRAWLLPFIHYLVEKGSTTPRELADAFEIRTSFAKTVLYMLKRLGLAAKAGEATYKPIEGLKEAYLGLIKKVRPGKDYACYTGTHYILVDVKRTRASAVILPAYLVEKIVDIVSKNPDKRPSEIGSMLGVHGRTVSRALRVYKLLNSLSQ